MYFASLGCSKNLVDSEVMLGHLRDEGYQITQKLDEARLIVVNTCGFILDAKEESVDTILEMVDHRKSNDSNCEMLVVTGCLSQRHPDELAAEIPEVDLWIGTGEYQHLVELIKESDQKIVVDVPTFIHTENDPRVNTSPFYSAWLKIAEGCNRRCSFCIIPYLRGNLRSRSVKSLVIEAKAFVETGVRELNLISQDTSLYGFDLDGENSLYNLLCALEEIDGLDWIRLFYIYPDDLTDDVIEKMASSKKICSYLDIPIQHFSTDILKKMNRTITGEKIIERVEKLRASIPGITLRTSIMVGFPGETEEDFEKLVEGVERLKFDHLGVFKYSPEEGTPSYNMEQTVSDELKEDRYREIYQLQEQIAEEKNESYIGKTIEVLVEGEHPDTELLVIGRHHGQAPDIDGSVIINDLNGVDVKIGDLIKVEVSEVLGFDLVGKVATLHGKV